MHIALDKAKIVGLVLECIFFGIFTLCFFLALSVLSKKSSTGRTSRVLVITVLLLYTLAITHLSIDVYRAVRAFIDYANIPHGSILFYGKLDDPTEIAKTALYALETIVADSCLVWRCYIVWNKNWSVIILPVTMVFGTTCAAVVVCWEFSRTKPGSVVFESTLVPWITSAWSTTLATTMICSGLIAFKIWQSQRNLKKVDMNSSLLPIMVIVIESGAVYSAALIAIITTYASGDNSQYIIVDFLPSLIGIVFILIIVRVSLGISSGNNTSVGSLTECRLSSFMPALRPQDENSDRSIKPMSFLTSVGVEEQYRTGHVC